MAAPDQTGTKPRSNETAIAIAVSLVVSIILATVFVGNPFTAVGGAYYDYTGSPEGAKVSATPATAPAPK